MEDVTVQSPESAKIVCKVTGVPQPNISWFFNGKPVIVDSRFSETYERGEAVLTIKTTKVSDAGVYTCAATNKMGSLEAEANLTVYIAPTIKNDPKFDSPVEIKGGTTLSIPVTVEGIPAPKITWKFNESILQCDNRISVDSSSGLSCPSIKLVTSKDAGYYTITAQNICGKASKEYNITVKDRPSPPRNLKVIDYYADFIVV